MKDGELDLIAQLLLESRIGAYIEQLVLGTNNRVPKEEELMIINIDLSTRSRARLCRLLSFVSPNV